MSRLTLAEAQKLVMKRAKMRGFKHVSDQQFTETLARKQAKFGIHSPFPAPSGSPPVKKIKSR